jgi:hypothetical protein
MPSSDESGGESAPSAAGTDKKMPGIIQYYYWNEEENKDEGKEPMCVVWREDMKEPIVRLLWKGNHGAASLFGR